LQPTNAAQLVRGVVEEFQSEMASSGCRVELTVEAPAPVVEADPDALAHALWNLLDNAVKYSPACRTVWVHVGGRDGEVAIGVRDRGLGIPANEQREVFRKFVRGEAARLYGIKGAGIGLAMVAHIVEAHRGRVVLESTPGEGSTFTILLPARS
jgi:two-component system phosphate regulon sensor histidine kinase PhoR